MSNIKEITGLTEGGYEWEATALCPMTGEIEKSIFCPHRQRCELLKVLVRAQAQSEAAQYAVQAHRNGEIPNCLNNQRFAVVNRGVTINFNLR